MVEKPSTATTSSLTPPAVAAVLALVGQASEADWFAGLNEAGLLQLRHDGPGVRHVLAGSSGSLQGYGQLTPGEPVSTGQLVVAPGARRQGVGTALLAELVAQSPTRLQVWALGNSTAAQALAARTGLVPARELLVMTRPLDASLREATLPAGVRVRAFVPGRDEEAWLGVNARAFASHPEQGATTSADLAERMAEPWFDAAGFLLAERDATLVGFHWTKRHSASLGEVYVLGVDPGTGGRGLGGALLDLGLAHLRDQGLSEVELYVESEHERAVGLYRGRGFTTASRDVMYAQP